MISVLASAADKTYPFEYMAALLDYIAKASEAQFLFNYIPSQEREARLIYQACKEGTRDRIFIDLFGKSLREFMGLTAHCTALIGNEGGAVNMAKALDIPTFTIFSPWIKPEDWAVFEDGQKHVSVHLRTFNNEPYRNLEAYKKLRKSAPKLYKEFKPELFQTELDSFLNRL